MTEETNKLFKLGRIVLVILAIFLAAEALGSLKSLKNIDPAYNSISVTGEGEAVAIPDVATFSFAISADAKTVAEAQTMVTTKMDATIKALRDMGIEERDIKTTNYSIYPKYTYGRDVICTSTFCPPARQIQDGYTASHEITVKVRDTEKAGQALALVGEKGATNVSGISFVVDDEDTIIAEAKRLAIQDAKEKAEVLADELGVKIVKVVSFHDNTGGPMPYYAEGFGAADAVRLQASPAPTIPSGENKFTVSVTVIYEIR